MALADVVTYATAHFALNENSSSDNAVDGINGITAVAFNSPTAVTGKFDGGRESNHNSQRYLAVPYTWPAYPPSGVQVGGDIDWTIRFWYQRRSSRVNDVIAQWDYAGHYSEKAWYVGHLDGYGGLHFYWSNDGTAQDFLSFPSGTCPINTWVLVHLVHDSVNNEVRFYVNASKQSKSWSSGIHNAYARIGIGTGFLNNTPATPGDSYFDDLVFVKGYAFTDTDSSEDYNSGSGVAFADWGGAGSPAPSVFLPAFGVGL